MKRRRFIALLGGVALAPLGARAQQPGKIWRIGFLRASPPPERDLEALLHGLAGQGYVQGQHFVLISKWGDGNATRLPGLAVALMNEGVDVIVSEGVVPVRTVRSVTSTVPIVAARSADPFFGGLVTNLSRPGGNITGFSVVAVDVAGKSLAMIKQIVPGLRRVAMLAPRVVWDLFAPTQDQAAKALNIDVDYFDLPTAEAVDGVVQQAIAAGAQAILVRGSPFFSSAQRRLIVDAAAARRIPFMFERRDYVEQGGLVSYSADGRDLYRRTAEYVVRVLTGTPAGELPIQQASKFELVVNLKTAKAQGIVVPSALLAIADEVIE